MILCFMSSPKSTPCEYRLTENSYPGQSSILKIWVTVQGRKSSHMRSVSTNDNQYSEFGLNLYCHTILAAMGLHLKIDRINAILVINISVCSLPIQEQIKISSHRIRFNRSHYADKKHIILVLRYLDRFLGIKVVPFNPLQPHVSPGDTEKICNLMIKNVLQVGIDRHISSDYIKIV